MKNLVLLFLLASKVTLAGKPPITTPDNIFSTLPRENLFEENKGQVTGPDAAKVKYVCIEQGISIFLLETGIAYQFNKTHYPQGYWQPDHFDKPEDWEKMEAVRRLIRTETYRMDVILAGANRNATISAEGESADFVNYYTHNALDVHRYNKITYHNIYPNIDWIIYRTGRNIKYDFVIHPGGNPGDIKLQTAYVEHLKLKPDGSLSLHNRMGAIIEQKPVSYQNCKAVSTDFVLKNDFISFKLSDFDPKQTLVIDPAIQWATYYGGSGRDYVRACAVDSYGNTYLAGHTTSTANIAAGGHQNALNTTFVDFDDAFLVKFDASGVRQWATYYGGDHLDFGLACAADETGNVYLAGYTHSSNNIAFGGYQNTKTGGANAFLVKFNASGLRQWATYYGGNGGAGITQGAGCRVDKWGDVYLAGMTYSTSNIAFGGHQNIFGGGITDAFLVKFNASGARLWATYYGGDNEEYGRSCAIDSSGNVYLSGETKSATNIASAGHQNIFGGGTEDDAFLVKFNSSGVRQWATYYGGPARDVGISCAVDSLNNVFLAGWTSSALNISSGGHQNVPGGGQDAYLAKFNPSGVRQWATYYGGNDADNSWSCTTDKHNNVYLAGATYSTANIAAGGYQNTIGGGQDAYIVKFDTSGLRQWATYYGGGGYEDHIVTCAVDSFDNVYLAGSTASDANIASGGHQNTFAGGLNDGFLAKFNSCTPGIFITSDQGNSICSGTGVTFTATPVNGGVNPSYQWKKNDVNVGTNADNYTSFTIVNGDVISCVLTSTAACASTATANSNGITMTVNSVVVPTVSIASNQGDSICSSTAVTFTATPANAGSYQWKKNGINVGTDSDNYTSSALANGDTINCVLTSNAPCASPPIATSENITMTVHDVPPVPIITASGDTLISSASSGNQWFLNDNPIAGATEQLYRATQSGSYQVKVTSNGCSEISLPFSFMFTNTGSIEHKPGYNIFPNPTEGEFILVMEAEPSESASIVIYNALGQLILGQPLTGRVTELNLSNQSAGIYYVQVRNNDKVELLLIKRSN